MENARSSKSFESRFADQQSGDKAGFPLQEPIAIIGMACRFPGSRGLSEFWRQLVAGENAVVEGPPGSVIGRVGQNVPDAHLRSDAVRFGAYLEDIDLFDAEFFRISPIEAQMLDPQQRLMLETSWEALEDAAIDPESLRGSRTGVYAGISNYDYREMVIDSPETAEAAGGLYAVTGTALNTAIGRVSFALGLEGPSMAIDTACSSSLVAIHQAIGGLQRNEAELAIAGGVHVFLLGRPLELRANAGMLSPTGQCWAFDASADGFVCGEGCGLVVLKLLSKAEADGDRIWGVIRGTSVNQDGASQGLTVPSAPSQQMAIIEALARAGVRPSDMDYLEAHGTGTVVGDPIELNAAVEVYGRGRQDDNPLLVGSVKTNIGHLGPAAGVAGLIKSVLAMRHGLIPKHLNFKDPNPRIDWNNLPVRIAAEMTDWPAHSGRPPLASVNSFGWSGTNSHLVVEGYREPYRGRNVYSVLPPAGAALAVRSSGSESNPLACEDQAEFGKRESRLLPLSGKSPQALSELAAQYLSWMEENIGALTDASTGADAALADMAWTAAFGRSHFVHRAGVTFSDVAQLKEQLEQVASGHKGTIAQNTLDTRKIAFVYTGQGSQWGGMGQALYDSEPVFRAVLDRCDRLLMEERGVSLLDVMFGRNSTEGLLDEPSWTQPAIYALECALTALWESVGITPSAVAGHSLGEIAASQAAGVFSLEEGLKFASARGTLFGTTRSDGAMAAVFASSDRVASAVAEHNATSGDVGLSIAADNGMQQVLSGPERDLEAVLQVFEAEGVDVRRLRKSPAYHSALVEPALDDLEVAVREIAGTPRAPSIPLVSNVTGSPVADDWRMDASYWRRHAREMVAFRSCVESLAEMGVDIVVEIGPHSILGPMVSMIWPDSPASDAPVVLHSLLRPRRDAVVNSADSTGGFLDAVAGAYEAGLHLHFPGLFAGEDRSRVSIPTYPFQRKHHWIQTSKRRRRDSGHALLGSRHESPRGEVMFEAELFSSDPAWMVDHLVYDRVVAPGGMYGAMAVTAALTNGDGPAIVDEMQTHNALILEDDDPEDPSGNTGRMVQFVLDGNGDGPGRRFEIFSKGEGESAWTLHADGILSQGSSGIERPSRLDLGQKRSELEFRDPADFYRMRSADEIYLGPSYHTLKAIWAKEGEALGELALQDWVDANGMEMHPLLLDGCFQVLSLARHLSGVEQNAVYMPFGWERLWVAGPMPERIVCHATLRRPASPSGSATAPTAPPEVITGDVNLFTIDGDPIGGLKGFTVKRATRSALLPARDSLGDIIYEVVWREKPRNDGWKPADFLVNPVAVARNSESFADLLSAEGVEAQDRAAFLADLELLSQSYALSAMEQLGWIRKAGATLSEESLFRSLGVAEEHRRLFGRLLGLLCEAGILSPAGIEFTVLSGAGDKLLYDSLTDPEPFADRVGEKYPQGANELGLLRRCGASLAKVLVGQEDALALLFAGEGASAADLYLRAPASRAANQLLARAVATAIGDGPAERPLRILEVGAGTGSATEAILPLLEDHRVEYTFTDISAGFFAQAEERLGQFGTPVVYKTLDIEASPAGQEFDPHSFDLVIAANVLHATRDLGETLANCRDLLAPSGQLFALEGMRRRAWQDLTFGLLDGWWRFSDSYRPDHALAAPGVWELALNDAGFSDAAFIEATGPGVEVPLGSGVIMARGPAEVEHSPGTWVIAADDGGMATALAENLVDRQQTVVLVNPPRGVGVSPVDGPGYDATEIDSGQRDAWRSLFENLPTDPPLRGVVHLMALDGRGADATTGEMAEDVTRAAASGLAMVQGILDASATPSAGVWFVTRGAQVLERDLVDRVSGQLSGSTLWGFERVLSMEAAHLQPKMIDLDPGRVESTVPGILDEFFFPGPERHIAFRGNERLAARLVRSREISRLALPKGSEWRIGPEDPEAGLNELRAKPTPREALQSGEVRIAVESMGLNFADMLLSMGAVEYTEEIGREVYGRIIETAGDVHGFAPGDPVVAVGFGGFTPEMVTRAVMVSPANDGHDAASLATVPICFVTAELAFDLSHLKAGERVLIHAGAGGVGLAAIQLAKAAGAEVFATASSPKQPYLRSLGVSRLYDSRQTAFGEEILQDTGGKGVDVILNSLTGEGFIDASLSCLGNNGRFVEIAKRNILSLEEMTAARPDVEYHILNVDTLKKVDPANPGASLGRVMSRLSAGELKPLPHTVWPLAEIRAAMDVMRDARHIGKNVFRMPPMALGSLRRDRTYLVTGGMGGIGCAVARWLSDNGAGTVVLNGRRGPDPEVEEAIGQLRESGVDVRVEIADVTDFQAVDDMLARIGEGMPTLGGVIHSVGVLSDGVIENQTWERFEEVMWPKVLGAWHLHQATRNKDLDLFVLFSSVTGVVGNPGQANHAAANAFLDQLAAHRRTLGLPAQAIAWGAWSGIGEAEEQRDRIERQLAYTGAGWITPQQGINALDWLVRQDIAAPTVTTVDWTIVTEGLESPSPLLEDLLVRRRSRERQSENAAPSEGLLSRVGQAAEDQGRTLLTTFIQEELKSLLRLSSPPSPTVSFFDLGMDSLMAVELRNRINRALAGELTASNTVVFDYPNASALADYLLAGLDALKGTAPAPRQDQRSLQPKQPQREDGIAIVGMACRFPGAPDLDSFWRLLESGQNAVTEGRQETGWWEGVLGDPGEENPLYRRGAFVEGIDLFDSRFFRISPIEARMMDPKQRMLLETGWQALEDAGVAPDSLRGSRTGVFVGVGGSEYRDLIASRGQEYSYSGTNEAVTAGRVAFALGLEGPAMPVDLACASSLAAVHQAVVSLERGEIDMALVGGVNAVLSAKTSEFLNDMGVLSPTGLVRAFDSGADGYVRGEGCGVVVLKRLSEAVLDGDRIWGVVLGSAVNQNGLSAGLMAPNGPAQRRAIEDALARAGLQPYEVDYLEAHGVGSQFGDPIELNAVAEVYGQGRNPDSPLLVGSVKSNIGHLEWASGVASLIKSVLSMQRQTIPPHLNFLDPSPHVDWPGIPLRITSETTKWPSHPDRPPRSAVNSFGLSGANAHVIVEGYGTQEIENGRGWPVGPERLLATNGSAPEMGDVADAPGKRRTLLLPLSGSTPNALRDLPIRYLEWLDATNEGQSPSGTVALADMAWTAGAGRSHFPCRAGLTFSDVGQLRAELKLLAEREVDDSVQAPGDMGNLAFLFTGTDDSLIRMVLDLYATEPVVGRTIDACNEIYERRWNEPLLDVFRRGAQGPDNPAAIAAAMFASECAVAALWRSVGIGPRAVVWNGLGWMSAAHAAGAISLEEGLALATETAASIAGRTEEGGGSARERYVPIFAEEDPAPSAVTMLNGQNGQVTSPRSVSEPLNWRPGGSAPEVSPACAEALVGLGVSAVIGMGAFTPDREDVSGPAQGTDGAGNAPARLQMLSGLQMNVEAADGPEYGGSFVSAVAKVYEAGATIDFTGLFAGEARRKVGLPGYPFQRRRHWVDAPVS